MNTITTPTVATAPATYTVTPAKAHDWATCGGFFAARHRPGIRFPQNYASLLGTAVHELVAAYDRFARPVDCGDIDTVLGQHWRPGREATALYLAARLLAQQTDEHNVHVARALEKLLDAMPSRLTTSLRVLAAAVASMHARGPDVSEIFSVLVQGWAHQKVVVLRYRARNASHAHQYQFCPYLFEPSGIGRTIYVLGATQPQGELRTFKMERMLSAHLLDEHFTVPEHFDGPALLERAWGVMYGDEAPVEVRLRFSRYARQRMKETIWHPSQVIIDLTDGGCEWTATIGDVTEIGPWVRGWGSDCEVLAPAELRADVIGHVRRMSRSYGLGAVPVPMEERQALDDIFG